MLKHCPGCGAEYTKEALEMFQATVKAGFKINLTCGNCGAAMLIDEDQVGEPDAALEKAAPDPTPATRKKWWQFWK
jgi:hypothetical protein